ncbi:MAG: hypothetical protein KF890_08015 [Nitrospira sp.]|nr:hypothetical protein [Nitrospira sp.]
MRTVTAAQFIAIVKEFEANLPTLFETARKTGVPLDDAQLCREAPRETVREWLQIPCVARYVKHKGLKEVFPQAEQDWLWWSMKKGRAPKKRR